MSFPKYPDNGSDDEYDEDERHDGEDDEDERHDDEEEERLFRCAALYKGGVICKAVSGSISAMLEHLKYEHHTKKWLVDEFVKTQNSEI